MPSQETTDKSLRVRGITVLVNFYGVIQSVVGDPYPLGLVKLENGEAGWWEMFALQENVVQARRQFRELRSNGRSAVFSLTQASDFHLRVELLRLSLDPSQHCCFVINIVHRESEQPLFGQGHGLGDAFAEERLALSMQLSQQVSWVWDMDSGKLVLKGGNGCLLGLEYGEIEPTEDFWWERTHPDDIENLKRAIEMCAEPGHDEWDVEQRLRASDGEYRWVRHRGRITKRGEDGRFLMMVGVTQLIHERKEKDFRQEILSQIHEGVLALDRHQRVTYCNEGALALLGVERDAIMGRALSAFAAEEQEELEEKLRAAARNGQFEADLKGPDGSVWRAMLFVSPLRDERDSGGYLVCLSDVTEREEALQQLRQSDRLLKAMSRQAKIGGWSLEVDSGKLEWTDEVYRIHEVDIGEPVDVETAISHYAPEAQPVITKAVEEAVKLGKGWDLELPFITVKGNRRWVRTLGYVDKREGRVWRLHGVFQDLTESDSLRRDLQEFFQTSEDLMALANFEGFIVRASDSWGRKLGYSEAELKARPFIEFVHPEDMKSVRRAFGRCLSGETISGFECRFLHRDGTYRWLSWTAKADLERRQTRASARDVTELKEVYRKLNDALAIAESASEAKSQFLAIMSHELRTPLNPIVGYSEMLADLLKDEGLRQMASTITRAASQLLRLIEDILDLSSIESGTYSKRRDEVTLNQLRAEIEAVFSDLAREKGLELVYEFSGRAGRPFLLDAHLLQNALSNLIGNAIKFTEKGFIKVALRVHDLGNGGRLEFAVTDSGIGIDRGHMEGIFHPFTQVDSSNTRLHGGTGLGLCICKRAIELLEGQISVESVVGEGTHFYGTVPFVWAVGAAAARDEDEPVALKPGTKVLVVEDLPNNRMVLKRYLERLGIDADEAEDGDEALVAHERRGYDLIFMDVHMLRVSGLEATKAIRRGEASGREAAHIVAVTADAFKEDRERCLEAGMDDYISKPVSMNALKSALRIFAAAADAAAAR